MNESNWNVNKFLRIALLNIQCSVNKTTEVKLAALLGFCICKLKLSGFNYNGLLCTVHTF